MILNAKKKLPNSILISSLVKHYPDFYKSILEAAERGELWEVSIDQNHFTQLELDFNSSESN